MPDAKDNYQAHPLFEDGRLIDIQLEWPERSWRLFGRFGAAREPGLADQAPKEALPVLLGSGLGLALERLLQEGGHQQVAVIDLEPAICELTGVKKKFSTDPRVLWLDSPDPEEVMAILTEWQNNNDLRPFQVIANPVYLRLNPPFYADLQARLEASRKVDFWRQARYAKFKTDPPRILLITSSYFLMGEMIAACRRLDVPHRFLNIEDEEIGRVEFVEQLLSTVLDFKPDFVFTINHLGVDREGALTELLAKLQLPMASWFVDNPNLILYLYENLDSPWTAIYTWDAANLHSLKSRGFPQVHYLPLGTDVHRFRPGAPAIHSPVQTSDVAFIGNSMQYKVARKLQKNDFPRTLLTAYKKIAQVFRRSDDLSVKALMESDFPELMPYFEALGKIENQLEYEVLVTHEATRMYRRDCLIELMPFRPLIAGDAGWKEIFRRQKEPWSYRPELAYYDELPGFYPCNKINFNCTSTQMKGAVNQRVFDVPATGSFVLTDWREQMENLFEPGREVACFRHPEEVQEMIRYYLKHPEERRRIAEAARKRILAEHTYDHRLKTLINSMREIYG